MAIGSNLPINIFGCFNLIVMAHFISYKLLFYDGFFNKKTVTKVLINR